MQKEDICWKIHELLLDLTLFKEASEELPLNGIYFFYEDGEYCEKDGTKLERIVRVGTHREQDNFRRRIYYHYNGNKNGSVFRKHLGGAIIARDGPDDPRLPDWLAQDTPTFPEVEERVSRLLQEKFCFRCIRVDDPNERLALEECLIATLSRCEYCKPSPNWLGRFAKDERIRLSGLWNSQHTDSIRHLQDRDWFSRFRQLVDATRAEAKPQAATQSQETPPEWNLVNRRIRECLSLPGPGERLDCLKKLFEETHDGMAAFALGQEFERQGKVQEALQFYRIAQETFPYDRYKRMASEAAEKLESPVAQELKKPTVLAVVCCTKKKIWDEDLTAPRYVPAQFAYRGPGFKQWMSEDRYRAKAKCQDFRWIILSAKYGFIEPWHPIEKYDVTFKDTASGPISKQSLEQQVAGQTRIWEDSREIKLSSFKTVVYYENCGDDYIERIKQAFREAKVKSWQEYMRDCSNTKG